MPPSSFPPQTDRILLREGPANHRELALLRGRLALAEGDMAAVAHYRAALARNPDDRDTRFGLAQALRLGGKPDEAKPCFRAAYERDLPPHPRSSGRGFAPVRQARLQALSPVTGREVPAHSNPFVPR
jgi:hypothetical protein